MLGWGHLRINTTLVCSDEVTWEKITRQYAGMKHTEVLLILMVPHSTILMCYWFSCDLISAYWCIIDSCVTLFQHTEVLLILMVPHSIILMCYWFSWYCIPAYWRVSNSRVTLFQHIEVLLIRINNTSVCWNEVTWESITHQYAGMGLHENQ
jgi:apolipoprotein N-acyltransferase